jgi:hypothetical protein
MTLENRRGKGVPVGRSRLREVRRARNDVSVRHGQDFYLLIEGTKNGDDDFFLIPFEMVAKHYKPGKEWKGTVKPERDRWILVVRGGQGFQADITLYRNAGPRPYR